MTDLTPERLREIEARCESARFPNLARHREEFDSAQPEVDAVVKAELEAAGIEVLRPWQTFRLNGEVPTGYVGVIEGSGWKFERCWRYYSAEGNGIPPEIAEQLHANHGTDVRVDGHCGCPSPTEWFKGFAVGRYHVDTPAGLKALADTIKGIMAAHSLVRADSAGVQQ